MLLVLIEIAKSVVFSSFEVATVLLIVGLIVEIKETPSSPNLIKYVDMIGK